MNLVLCIWLAYECEQVGHGLFSKFRCGSLPIKYWSWTRFSAANSAVCEIDSSKRRTTMGDLIYSSRGLFSACVFERRQRDQWQIQAEDRLKPRHRKALDGFGLNQIGEQRQRRFHQRIEPENADPAHLDQADDGRGWAGDDPVADPDQLGLIVGDQLRPGVNQPQG